jgi:hypothetical protein
MIFIIISALHVWGGFSAHHQELIKLYVQPWVLSCFPAVYRWCGWVGTVQRQPTYTMFFIIISALHVSGGFSAHHQEPRLHIQFYTLLIYIYIYIYIYTFI